MSNSSLTASVSDGGIAAYDINWKVWALWFAAFALLSAVFPRDAVFDIAHYHIHNGWSAQNGRITQDMAPADLHSFLNPIHSLVVWALIERLPGPMVIALLSPVQAALLPLLYAFGARLAVRVSTAIPRSALLICAVAGFLAVANMFTFASIGNDHWGAAAFLAALVLILGRDASPRWRSFAMASALLGAATGMKLTNAIYIPGFAFAVLCLTPSWQARVQRSLVCALFGAVGLILLGGWWAGIMWSEFGNPVFPHLNAVFGHSELGPSEAFRDTRYLPKGWIDALARPFFFAFNTGLIFEFELIDFRFLIAYLTSFSILVWLAIKAVRAVKMPQGTRFIVAFGGAVLITYFGWAGAFSILRYASALWMLAPVWTLVVGLWVFPEMSSARSFRAIIIVACGALILTTSASPNRRVAWTSWSEPYVWTELPDSVEITDSIIVFSALYPTAFTAPAFSQAAWLTHADSHAWSAPALVNYRPFIRQRLADSDAPIFAVMFANDQPNAADLNRLAAKMGLGAQVATCQPMRTGFDLGSEHWVLCPLTRTVSD